MKKLLILVSEIIPKRLLFSKILSKRFGKDVEVVLAEFSRLFIQISDGVQVLINDIDIKEYDLVYIRKADHSMFSLSGTLAICLDYLGIKYFDTKFREIGAAGDKFTALTKLCVNGVIVPKTIFCRRGVVVLSKEEIVSRLNLPIIAKDIKTQGNSGIYLIRSMEDFDKLLRENENRRSGTPIQFIFQEFIKIEREYRILVLGDKVGASHTKVKRAYNKFVIDYEDKDSQPEFIDPVTLPDSLKEVAIKAARILNVEIAGVDVCIEKGSGRILILEVNRGPGFEYDTKISPELPAVADFLKKEIGK